MTETPDPQNSRPAGEMALPLPSLGALAKATAVAAVGAGLLLVFVVLPAEYGIDPTGFGAFSGLSRLSEAAAEVAAEGGNSSQGAGDDVAVVLVPAGGGVEYKYFLKTGETIQYSWAADASSLFYDFHGEPEGDTTGSFVSHAASTARQVRGSFTAPFAGTHGWYWKNSGAEAANVTLVVSGSFEVVGIR